MLPAKFCVAVLTASFFQLSKADDCQPINWKRDVGDIICRYQASTPSLVNYYTCSELAIRYGLDIKTFFKLNPNMDKDCDSVQPNTDYCVRGFATPLVSIDGFCGPDHGNATCLGSDFQCCNSKTWKCGNEEEDCSIGVCYSGACMAQGYTTTGKCGPKNTGLQCGGTWGSCCNFDGDCGSGSSFCGPLVCESGNCTDPIPAAPSETALPWQTGTTPDGTCGGSNGYTCDIVFGKCCGKDGICGSEESCGAGCLGKFGKCNDGNTDGGSEPVPGYYAYGCYTEATGQRALSAFTIANFTSMTQSMCATFCIDTNKMPLFGVEYGGECYCGTGLNPGAIPATSGCNMACPGNATQTCGGPDRLNLFGVSPSPPSSGSQLPTSTTRVQSSTVATTPTATSGFTYLGCFTEGIGIRALKDAATFSDTMMSAAFCGEYCRTAGYQLFGTEYARECWCGSALDTSSMSAPENDCSFACTGDAGQKCGAGNRLSVYRWI